MASLNQIKSMVYALIFAILACPFWATAMTCEGVFRTDYTVLGKSNLQTALNNLIAPHAVKLTEDQAELIFRSVSAQNERLQQIGVLKTSEQREANAKRRLQMIANLVRRDDYWQGIDSKMVGTLLKQYRSSINDLDMSEYFRSAIHAFYPGLILASREVIQETSLSNARRLLRSVNFDRVYKYGLPEVSFEDFILVAARGATPTFNPLKDVMETILMTFPSDGAHRRWSEIPKSAVELRGYLQASRSP
jgi:hypothetical protein